MKRETNNKRAFSRIYGCYTGYCHDNISFGIEETPSDFLGKLMAIAHELLCLYRFFLLTRGYVGFIASQLA